MPAETHSHQEHTRSAVRGLVHEWAADVLGVPRQDVQDSTPLTADTLALAELVDMCAEELAERTLGFDTADDTADDIADEAAEWRTVGDVVTFVADRVGAGDTAGEPD